MNENKTKTVPTAIGTKIIIIADETATASRGGVIIPDTAQEAPRQGTVFSVGEGYLINNGTIVPLTLKKGDKVIFPKHHCQVIEVDDVEYVVANDERDIICRLDEVKEIDK